MIKFLRIILVVATCLAVGFLSSKFTQQSINTWYPTLIKPVFNPPNWIFAPVWTTLYILMGIAAGIIWNQYETNKKQTTTAFQYFIAQLALNFLWSYLFFGLQNILLALIEIILLWLLILETYNTFKKINPTAANLLIPYILWVTFAAILNCSLWYLN